MLKNKQLPEPGELLPRARRRRPGPHPRRHPRERADERAGRLAATAGRRWLLRRRLTGCQGVYDLPLPGRRGDRQRRLPRDGRVRRRPRPGARSRRSRSTTSRSARSTTITLRRLARAGHAAAARLGEAAGQRRGRAAPDQPAGREVRLAVAADRPSRRRAGSATATPSRCARTGRNPEVEEVLGALSLVLNGGGVAQLKTINVELTRAMAGHEERHQGRDPPARHASSAAWTRRRATIVRALDGLDRLSARLAAQKGDIADGHRRPRSRAEGARRPAQRSSPTMLTALSDLGRVGTRVINASQGRHGGQPAGAPADPHQAGRRRRQPAQGARDARHLPVPAGGDRRGARATTPTCGSPPTSTCGPSCQPERRQEPGPAVAAPGPEPDRPGCRPAADRSAQRPAAARSRVPVAAAHVDHGRARVAVPTICVAGICVGAPAGATSGAYDTNLARLMMGGLA